MCTGTRNCSKPSAIRNTIGTPNCLNGWAPLSIPTISTQESCASTIRRSAGRLPSRTLPGDPQSVSRRVPFRVPLNWKNRQTPANGRRRRQDRIHGNWQNLKQLAISGKETQTDEKPAALRGPLLVPRWQVWCLAKAGASGWCDGAQPSRMDKRTVYILRSTSNPNRHYTGLTSGVSMRLRPALDSRGFDRICNRSSSQTILIIT